MLLNTCRWFFVVCCLLLYAVCVSVGVCWRRWPCAVVAVVVVVSNAGVAVLLLLSLL